VVRRLPGPGLAQVPGPLMAAPAGLGLAWRAGPMRQGWMSCWPRARQIDSEHRLRHNRPVFADTLRRQMRIGSMRARMLVRHIRDVQDPSGR
jgi:hypothetical protein